MIRLFLALFVLLVPTAVHANSDIELTSSVFVERLLTQPDGRTAVSLEAPERVLPGDRLVFVLNYRNIGSQTAKGVVVRNPLPRSIAFQATGDGNELVSVDGGQSWGRLSEIRIRTGDGNVRHAVPEDVTHLMWKLDRAVFAGSGGKLSFRGVVR